MDLSEESQAKSRNSYVIFGAGLLAGAMLGLFVGTVVLHPNGQGEVTNNAVAHQGNVAHGDSYAKAFKVVDVQSAWIPLPIKWSRLKPFAEAGAAPLVFTTPALMYDYGAISHPLPANLITGDVVLRVDVSDVKGLVGVSLVDPAGDPLKTQEQGVSSADGKRSVFFKVRPQDLPAEILLRNYGDASGTPGSISVNQVFYAPLSSFSSAQQDALNQMGLNKGLK